MNDPEFMMSLVVRHPDVDPMRITRALGLQPGHVWREGEPRKGPTGDALVGKHRESYWICELVARPKFSVEPARVESELATILQMLRKSMDFLQDLHHGGGVIELLVTVFARGDFRMKLLPDEAALLGRMGVSLTIEIRSGQLPVAAAATN